MTCVVCKTKFFHQSWSSPSESCDCGMRVDALAYREMTEAEQHDVARAIEAWPVKCESCFDKTGAIVAGPFDDHGDHICDNCLTSRAEAAHERMLEDYYGGSGPVTINEHYQAAAKQKREER